MSNHLLRYAEVVHALHEDGAEEAILDACLEWLDHYRRELPPLCCLDLSSSAIN